MENTRTGEELQPEIHLGLETFASESSRKAFLGTLMAGAAAATTLAAGSTSAFAASGKLQHLGAHIPASDAAILNFALTLEHLEATFYQKAAHRFGTNGSYTKRLIYVLRGDEEAHVNALTAAIRGQGYKPVGEAATYHFGGAFKSQTSFLEFAAKVEDTGVHAYLGQVPNLKTKSLVVTAAEIMTVEARHTGAIRGQLRRDPTDGAFDHALTKNQILGIVGPLIG